MSLKTAIESKQGLEPKRKIKKRTRIVNLAENLKDEIAEAEDDMAREICIDRIDDIINFGHDLKFKAETTYYL